MAIIRPVVEREYTALPNSILTDNRLSIDTRAMLAFLFSRPRSWEIRPKPLAKALSGPNPLGAKRLKRMIHEAMAAGYMARSAKQDHQSDGSFGRYEYFVGLPIDVTEAVKNSDISIAKQEGVGFLPQRREACTLHARTRDGTTIHKVMNLQNTDSINPPLSPQRSASPNGLATRHRIEGPEVVQHRLAMRLGAGDAAHGWRILLALPQVRLDELTASERAGKLTDLAIAQALAAAPSAGVV